MLCSFCNNNVARGTGFLYVRKDGSHLSFCSQKCKKNMLNLKRVGKKVKWTAFEHATSKKGGSKAAAGAKGAQAKPAAKQSPK
ncbi:hypothetical protein FJZ26_03895 [Candidatus Parvarchaeota archaeon]|nr:hypothetical protein [Candidatus Parvarchaeota archaeon]